MIVTAMIMFITCMYVQWNPSKAGSQCDTGAMSIMGVVGKSIFLNSITNVKIFNNLIGWMLAMLWWRQCHIHVV